MDFLFVFFFICLAILMANLMVALLWDLFKAYRQKRKATKPLKK